METINDTFLNGKKKHINGASVHIRRKTVTTRNANRDYSRDKKGQFTQPENAVGQKGKREYKWEKYVMVAGLVLVGAAGIQLAIQTGGTWLMTLGQVLGFTASTVSLIVVKRGLHKGKYMGRQRRYAESFFFWGTVFESLTLVAKYAPWFVSPYLLIVSFTLPALILGMHKLITSDPEKRYKRMVRENKIMKARLANEEEALNTRIRLLKKTAKLRAQENVQLLKSTALEKESTSRASRKKAKRDAKEVMIVIHERVGEKPKKRALPKPQNVEEAKVTGESHTRKTMGPRKKKCKADGCDNWLTGKQRTYCSNTCGSRMRAKKARQKKQEG